MRAKTGSSAVSRRAAFRLGPLSLPAVEWAVASPVLLAAPTGRLDPAIRCGAHAIIAASSTPIRREATEGSRSALAV